MQDFVQVNSDRLPEATVSHKRSKTSGVHYAMMSFGLWLFAGSLIVILLTLANGETSLAGLSSTLAVLLVSFPVYAYFFIRSKKAERTSPEIKLNRLRRRMAQITQIVAFLTVLINTMVLAYELLERIGGTSTQSIPKTLVNWVIVTIVAGGVLALYWYEENKASR